MPLSGQYMKRAAIGSALDGLDGGSLDWIKGLKSAFVFTTVRQEKLEIDGQIIDCWVIEMKAANPNRVPLPVPARGLPISFSELSGHYWIDKETGLQRQMVSTGKVRLPNSSAPQAVETKTVYRSVKFDEPLPDSLFQFTPPAGAKEIANMLNLPDLSGKAAPNFQITSLDGKPYSLSELKNKVIVLDFWASWCVPCRQETPSLNNLYRDLKEKDLIVIGVDVGEDSQTVEKFLKTAGITFPVALTAGTDIASDYHVTSYPTYIVIGRDGVVAGEQVGRRGDQALRDLVAKAYISDLPDNRINGFPAAANSARSAHNIAATEEAYNAAFELAISKEMPRLSPVAIELAIFLEQQQQPEKAEAVLQRTSDAEEAGGQAPWTEIQVLMRLRDYQSRRKADLAPIETRLVKAWESMAGPESVVVANNLFSLVSSLEQAGRFAEAEQAIQRAIAILTKSYGSNAPSVGAALRRLASLETRLGKDDLADTPFLGANRRSLWRLQNRSKGLVPRRLAIPTTVHSITPLHANDGRRVGA
jgi:thiol-disulfide isomerase/thioredoxin